MGADDKLLRAKIDDGVRFMNNTMWVEVEALSGVAFPSGGNRMKILQTRKKVKIFLSEHDDVPVFNPLTGNFGKISDWMLELPDPDVTNVTN